MSSIVMYYNLLMHVSIDFLSSLHIANILNGLVSTCVIVFAPIENTVVTYNHKQGKVENVSDSTFVVSYIEVNCLHFRMD